ncbi:hypothetical protein COCVIDRAFT_95793, partial [Bipolaris victoriae FI3]
PAPPAETPHQPSTEQTTIKTAAHPHSPTPSEATPAPRHTVVPSMEEQQLTDTPDPNTAGPLTNLPTTEEQQQQQHQPDMPDQPQQPTPAGHAHRSPGATLAR